MIPSCSDYKKDLLGGGHVFCIQVLNFPMCVGTTSRYEQKMQPVSLWC